jgi:hypothetical protein
MWTSPVCVIRRKTTGVREAHGRENGRRRKEKWTHLAACNREVSFSKQGGMVIIQLAANVKNEQQLTLRRERYHVANF